jgi:HlyD family secretion protein
MWLILIIVLAVAVKAGTMYFGKSSKPASAGTTITVERGDIQAVVSATGTISPVNMVDVSSKITGLITEVKVNENDQVKTGQVLILLDDSRLKSTVAQAEARLVNATASLKRTRQLASIGAFSTQQLDSAEMDYNVAQASYDDAVSQLEDTEIKAPIDGLVIGKPIPAGQTVAPGIANPMVLLTIADMSKMQISVQVDESDIGKVVVGQKVTFTVDSYPGKTFTGIVSNVSKKASVQQNVVYYPVTVDIDEPEGLLKPTMTARVTINVGESKNTLIIPLSAVKENKGQQFVQVMVDGKPQNRPVKLGLASDDKTEVLSGLADGEQILMPSSKQQQGGPGGQANPNMLRGVMR